MKFPLVFILFLPIGLLSAQEQEFDLGYSDHDIPYEATLVEDRLYFSISTFDQFPLGQVRDSHLMLLDMQMNLLDSVSMNSITNVLERTGITSIETYQDSLAAVCIAEGSWQKYARKNQVLFYNKYFNLVDSVHINSNATGTYFHSTRLSNIYDSLLIVSSRRQDTVIDSVYYPHVSVLNRHRNVVKQKSYKNIGIKHNKLLYEPLDQFTFFNNKFISHPSYPVSFLVLVSLNSDFSYDSAYQSSDFTPVFHYNLDRFLHSGSEHLYTAGYINSGTNIYSYGLLKFDEQLKYVRMDTIALFERTLDQEGCIDYQSLNNIIFAVSEYDNVDGSPFIHLASMDTSGAVNWRSKIFQDSAIKFVVLEVEATPDGGAFIISHKLDARQDPSIWKHTASVIKIDSLGQVVGEREWQLRSPFELFPNPASEMVHFQGIAAREKLEVKIFEPDGKLVKVVAIGNKRELDVSELPSGTYVLSLKGRNKKYIPKKLVIE